MPRSSQKSTHRRSSFARDQIAEILMGLSEANSIEFMSSDTRKQFAEMWQRSAKVRRAIIEEELFLQVAGANLALADASSPTANFRYIAISTIYLKVKTLNIENANCYGGLTIERYAGIFAKAGCFNVYSYLANFERKVREDFNNAQE